MFFTYKTQAGWIQVSTFYWFTSACSKCLLFITIINTTNTAALKFNERIQNLKREREKVCERNRERKRLRERVRERKAKMIQFLSVILQDLTQAWNLVNTSEMLQLNETPWWGSKVKTSKKEIKTCTKSTLCVRTVEKYGHVDSCMHRTQTDVFFFFLFLNYHYLLWLLISVCF